MFEIDNMIKRMMKEKNKKNSTIGCDCRRYAKCHLVGMYRYWRISQSLNRFVEVSEVEGEENKDLPMHMVTISPAIGNARWINVIPCTRFHVWGVINTLIIATTRTTMLFTSIIKYVRIIWYVCISCDTHTTNCTYHLSWMSSIKKQKSVMSAGVL